MRIHDIVRVVRITTNGTEEGSFARYIGQVGQIIKKLDDSKYPFLVKFTNSFSAEYFSAEELKPVEEEVVEGVVQLKITKNLLKIKSNSNEFIIKNYTKPVNVGDTIKVYGAVHYKKLVTVYE